MTKVSILLAGAALAITAQPALARDPHVDAVGTTSLQPVGVSVTMGVRIPLGRETQASRRPTYGLTMGYDSRSGERRPGELVRSRRTEIMQLNFDGAGMRDLQVANFSFTQFGRDDVPGRRANLSTGATIAIVGGVVVAGVVVASAIAVDDMVDDCNRDGDCWQW